jgi:hypothetical protein
MKRGMRRTTKGAPKPRRGRPQKAQKDAKKGRPACAVARVFCGPDVLGKVFATAADIADRPCAKWGEIVFRSAFSAGSAFQIR